MKELFYGRLLLPAAEHSPDAISAIEGDVRESLGVHVQRSVRLADALRRTLTPGGVFAVLATNSRFYINLWHAALLGCGRINPLNARHSEPELAAVLRDSDAEILFVDATFAPLAERLRGQLPALRLVVSLHERVAGTDLSLDELIASGDDRLPPDPDEDTPVWIAYTGGTTGRPKGVVHTQRAALLTTYRLNQLFDFSAPGNVFLSIMPLFHFGACAAILGMPPSGNPTVHAPFVPDTIPDVIARHQVTQIALAPLFLAGIVNQPELDPSKLSSLRFIGYGGAPMPASLQDRATGLVSHVEFTQVFGMTESCGILTYLTPEDHRVGGPRLRSVGRALPGNEIRIVDPGHPEDSVDGIGEVCVRSGSILSEYHHNPAETAHALSSGWFRTGDVGYLDDGGYLYLVDRAKDMIITGAENVYSVEVEEAIAAHPAVDEVAVIGIPHEHWGEAVHAVVVIRPGLTVDATTLTDHARQHIAGYKVPKSIEFRTAPLPRSAAGKVLKRELRAPYRRDEDTTMGDQGRAVTTQGGR